MSSVRINISLPEETFKELSRDIKPRRRSRFITEAVKSSLKELKKKQLAAISGSREGNKANQPATRRSAF